MINKVFNEDCLITMSRIEDKSINLIIADFPYFEVKGEFDFIWKDFDEFLEWVETCAKEFKRILSDNGSLYIYGSAKKIAYKQIIFDKYFNLENNLVWYKPDCLVKKNICGYRSFSTATERILFYSNEIKMSGLEGISSNMDLWKFIIAKLQNKNFIKEKAFEIFKNDGRYTSKASITTHVNYKFGLGSRFDLMDSKLFDLCKQEFKYNFTYNDLKNEYEYLMEKYKATIRPFNNTNQEDVLFFNQEMHNYNKYNHPTQKPPKLSAELIKISSRENDLVYIPFGGSGTELEQCHLLNRRYIGSELESKYCDIIEDRLKNAKGEVGLFCESPKQGALL